MDLSVYLIGQITKNPVTYEWRKVIREIVEKLPREIESKIKIIDPCNNSFSKRMLAEANGKNVDFSTNVVKNLQSKLFPAIDKSYVKIYSNACIFNANHYSPETPFIGTIYELAWYHDQPEKPVVGIFDGNTEEDYLCKHPFVQDTVHAWVKNEQQALELLLSLLHD
jgi:hypothetical protein